MCEEVNKNEIKKKWLFSGVWFLRSDVIQNSILRNVMIFLNDLLTKETGFLESGFLVALTL